MSASDQKHETPEQVLELADEFLDRHRSGEQPRIAEYVERYPQHADAIQSVFATMMLVEAAAIPDGEPSQQSAPSDTTSGHEQERFDPTSTDNLIATDTATVHSQAGTVPDRQIGDPRAIPAEFGRYRVERLLGSGAMGSVYLAQDSQLDRRVAIKLPRFDDADAVGRDRFQREARAMATVRHPNLCPVYDVGEQDGREYLTMAFIDGRSLAKLLSEGRTYPAADAARLVEKLARAVHVLHNAGIVHRDLKPGNVMIDAQGEPVVMDFGLARRERPGEADLTHERDIVGSPAYMSPEQVRAEHDRIGPATDVYSLGVILYQLLCGRRPFEGSVLSILGQVQNGTPHPLREQLPHVDPMLEAVCLKAMAHEIDDRHASADDLSEALRDWLANDTNGQTDAAQSAYGRSRSIRILTAVAGLLLAAIVVYRIATNDGEIVIRAVEGAEFNVEIRENGRLVDVIGPEDGWRVSVGAGTYELSLRTQDRSLRLIDGNTAVVVRDGVAEIRVTRQPAAVDSPPDVSHLLPPSPVPAVESKGRLVDSGQRFEPIGATWVEFGDLDGDGDLDAIFARGDNGSCRVWTNDGTGVFSDSGQAIGPLNARSAVPGDVDADGDLDIVLAIRSEDERVGAPNEIWLNDGAGAFQDSGQRLGSASTWEIELNDLDGDGDLDGFAANRNQPDRVWLNDGAGRFSASGQSLAHSGGMGVALGDLDGDGDQDAYVANRGADHLWLNDGTGQFTLSPQQLNAVYALQPALCDYDRDGDLDVFIANLRGHCVFLMNNGRGELARQNRSDLAMDWSSMTIADLNGDRQPDLISTTDDGQPNTIWFNDGSGNPFSNPVRFGSAKAVALAAGDVDGDGDLDLFEANFAKSARVLLNQSLTSPQKNLRFVVRQQAFERPFVESRRVAFGDLDDDGDIDVFSATHGPDTVVFNDGRARFDDSGQRLGDKASYGVALGDLDADGDLDAFVATNHGHPDHVWLNNGAGGFESNGQQLGYPDGAGNGFDVDLADFDRDGDLDAFVTCHRTACALWTNDGTARFELSDQQLPVLVTADADSGDIDGDGDIDVWITNRSGNDVIVLNDGSGDFVASDQELSPAVTYCVQLGDLDGDGDLDAVTANQNSASRVWLNDGSGAFTDSGQFLSGLTAWSMDLGDVDGDGDLDAYIQHWGAEPACICLNDGTGNLETLVWIGNCSMASGLVDLDGDGDLDVLSRDSTRGVTRSVFDMLMNQTLPNEKRLP